MAISDAQFQDLINKVNVINFQVAANLNTPISSVLSNVINGNNAIQNRLTQVANQARSDTNYQTNIIGQYVNGAIGRAQSDIKYTTDNLTRLILEQSAKVSDSVQKKIDASNSIIQKKIDSINGELKQQIVGILNPVLVEVDKKAGEITANLTNGILGAQTDIRQATVITNNLIQNTSNNILTKLNAAATTTAANVPNTPIPPPTTGGFLPGSDPYNPYVLLQNTIDEFRNQPPTPQDSIASFIIRLTSGNQAADTLNTLSTVDFIHPVIEQINKLSIILQKAINGGYHTLDDLNNELKQLGVDSPIVGSLVQLFFGIINVKQVAQAFGLPLTTRIEQLSTASYALKQLSEVDVLESLVKNNINADQAKKLLDELGHKPADSELLMKNASPKLDIDSLFRLAYLGKIDDKTLFKWARELGWTEDQVIRLGYVKQPRPGIQDLITFAVKEVYSPEVTNKFGQYEDFPKQFADQAKLLGLSEEFARQFWAAHWALPGANQGFDLFHRGLISESDLKTLLKALDVMPFWRDKLINLSYNLVTRVDVRRLYAYGIWDKNRVYRAYLDEGYSPKDATDLTQFTIQYDAEQDNKHKTKLQTQAYNTYIKAFKYDLLDKNSTKNKIVALGYKSDEVQLALDLEEYESYLDEHKPKKENHVNKMLSLAFDGYKKRSIGRADFLGILTKYSYTLAEANTEADILDQESDILFKEQVVKEIQNLYLQALLDDNATLTRLMALGFTNGEALHIIAQLQTLKGLDDKKPTPAQFKAMYEAGIIDQTTYKFELESEGYNGRYIPWIIALSDGKAGN